MTRNLLKVIVIFIIGMVGGIFADQIFWPYFVERPLFYEYSLEKAPVYVTEIKKITIQENTAITEAVGEVEKVVVGIRTETVFGEILESSGLIVTSDGLMVTLATLVPQGSSFSFFVDEKKIHYQILKRDLKTNLALIKLEEENLQTCSFANLDELKLGEKVFLIGIIFEEELPLNIVNEGIVKSFNENYIKTNIFENYFLAGSPLFNIKGEVLGLNTIDSEGKVIAIPITKIKQFIGI